MSKEYEEFQKFIRQDMIKEWNNVKLSYIVRKYNLDLILQRDSSLTIQKIMEDFQKSPLVKEVIMSGEQIVIFPK
jgi:hypothetical protein